MARRTEYRIDLDEAVRTVVVIPRPEFEFSFHFVNTKENRAYWIGKAGGGEPLDQDRRYPLSSDSHSIFLHWR
jgi:hypothetical protein